ncbi:MAG: hypothetical protein HYV27_16255 [Candidatus Hydrogenedentes bacterium]|nr:hypothetical protein [Candidatus Hydrogenedentota bacterium]
MNTDALEWGKGRGVAKQRGNRLTEIDENKNRLQSTARFVAINRLLRGLRPAAAAISA